MPITPRVQRSPSSTGSISHNGHANAEASTSYAAKESLLAPAIAAKPVPNLFDRNTVRYHAGISPNIHMNDVKMKVGWEESGRISSAPIGTRNDIKEEAKEGDNSSSVSSVRQDELFPSYFKSSRTRAWEKSRRIDSDQWTLTRDELIAQLRPEEDTLVPLNAIAGRVVLYGWQLFANQVEINASLPPLRRRKRIYDDAHEARKQLIKLLVLVQWSKAAPILQLTRNLVAHINDHFAQADAAVNSLSETRSILANARLRNYDLKTAIEVLGTGAPQRIPPLLRSAIQATKPFTNAETLKLVKELDETIRLRLACEEIIPLAMTTYTICKSMERDISAAVTNLPAFDICSADGRASFRVPRLFEADLTLSGSNEEDRWWLLRIKFDFKVTGEGADRFPRQPKKNQRLNLLALADVELAPRSVAAVIEQGAANEETEEGEKREREKEAMGDVEMSNADTSLTLDDDGSIRRRDAPLIRLYNLLQSQALHYWLDILHFQALQQVRLIWGRRLSVQMKTTRTSRLLEIGYWQRLPTDPQLDSTTWLPTAGGNLVISVREKAKEDEFEKTVKRLLTTSQEDSGEHGRGQIPERLELYIEWKVSGPASELLDLKNLAIDPQNLDSRRTLLEVTSRHVEASLKVIKARILSSSLERLIVVHDRSRLTADGFKERFLHLNLSDKVTIALRIDQMSGQFRLEDAKGSNSSASSAAWSNHHWIKHLREVSTKMNEKPDQIVTILQNLQCKVILEDLQEKSTLLGITVTTRMPLRQVDFAKLRAKAGTLLYITLLQCPSYYLVIHTGEECLRVALMCAGTFLEDSITSMRIVSLEWLDWQRVVSSPMSPKALFLGKRKREEGHSMRSFTQEELSTLYSYSVALICYHKVEQQLRARGLQYVHVGGWTNLRSPPLGKDTGVESTNDVLSRIVPSLCLKSTAFFHGSALAMTNRNISIRLHQWWDPSKAHVLIAVKLKLQEGLVVKEDITDTAQEKIHFDTSTKILSFLYRDIDNCLDNFISGWKHVERILDLSREVLSSRQADYFTLLECDLVKVRFTYSKNLLAEVQWLQDLTMPSRGSYHLKLGSTLTDVLDAKKNPHQVIKSSLIAWLNKQDDSSSLFWLKFLKILRQTLPILKHVYEFTEQYYESVECPELQIQNPCRFRLVFWDRYNLDIHLVKGDKVLFSDGTHIGSNPQDSVSQAAAATATTTTTTATTTTKDDLSFDEAISALLTDAKSTVSSTPSSPSLSSTIPSMHTILNDLFTQYQQYQKENENDGNNTSQASTLVLVFPNGLLCPNNSDVIDFFLPRLIKRIQGAIE